MDLKGNSSLVKSSILPSFILSSNLASAGEVSDLPE